MLKKKKGKKHISPLDRQTGCIHTDKAANYRSLSPTDARASVFFLKYALTLF